MISDLQSGECRYIGREDIHVYCRHPLVETMTGWVRRPEDARYCVVCPDAGLEYGHWVTADEAAVLVDRALAGTVPAAA
jgi:hypothetical protein